MPIKPWDEWDWTPEEFVIFSTKNGKPMLGFPIGRLPDIPYNTKCNNIGNGVSLQHLLGIVSEQGRDRA